MRITKESELKENEIYYRAQWNEKGVFIDTLVLKVIEKRFHIDMKLGFYMKKDKEMKNYPERIEDIKYFKYFTTMEEAQRNAIEIAFTLYPIEL